MSHLPPATWERLPKEFKVNVAEYLDLPSRLNLRQCSTIDQWAVDRVPIHLRNLKISSTSWNGDSKFFFTRSAENSRRLTLEMREVVSRFLFAFSSKKSTVELLEVGDPEASENTKETWKLIKIILKEVQKQMDKGHKFAWKIKKLKWNIQIRKPFTEFLSLFDPTYLKFWKIKGHSIDKTESERMFELKQWKSLNTIRCFTQLDCDDFSNFYHIDNVLIMVKNIDAKELASFIKNLHSRDLPYYSYFGIINKTDMDDDFKNEVFSYFDPKIPDENFQVFEHEDCDDGDFIRRIRLPEYPLCFAVRITKNQILGGICQDDNGLLCELSSISFEIGCRTGGLMDD